MGRNNEIYGGCNMETYITICKIDTNGNLQYVSENSNRGSVSTCRGGVGREIGGRFKSKRTYACLWLLRLDRKQQDSVKQLSFN